MATTETLYSNDKGESNQSIQQYPATAREKAINGGNPLHIKLNFSNVVVMRLNANDTERKFVIGEPSQAYTDYREAEEFCLQLRKNFILGASIFSLNGPRCISGLTKFPIGKLKGVISRMRRADGTAQEAGLH
ncbi:hypothetical protein MRB53_017842 [Persea americana]|uniref:Uncharacterized protein n=1 Tax=Persea americana TaxID=3435 RepID=A0ACC2M6X2_PERAE|nr:hypothetical protein MRB53_017842 [Persea americana]